jgi:hypothetical protein
MKENDTGTGAGDKGSVPQYNAVTLIAKKLYWHHLLVFCMVLRRNSGVEFRGFGEGW